jgi:hypothetical protein
MEDKLLNHTRVRRRVVSNSDFIDAIVFEKSVGIFVSII